MAEREPRGRRSRTSGQVSEQSPQQTSPAPNGTPRFDVFLSHSSADKLAVKRIAEKLKRAGLEPWLDAWCLTGGRAWQAELVAGVQTSSAFAFFVGPHGQGDWAREELDLAQDRAAKDRGTFRLIPVLLPGLPEAFDASTLPPFLRMRTWVDLRAGLDSSRALEALINAIRGVPFGPELPIEPRDDVCPYRGLEPFDEAHADFFFGRDGEVQRLIEKLKATRFLAVLGPSGSGKSSLVRAGLLPALRRGGLPDGASWMIRVLKPGQRPLTELAIHLANLCRRDALDATVDRLRADQRTLDLDGAQALAGHPNGSRLVWVIDQFEEVFTLCHDDQERAQLLANLLYAAAVPGGRSVVVLTMRADFYHRCAAYPALAAQVAAQQLLVSPMDRDDLRQAIEAPARRVGLELEAGLAETILDDVADRPGALPLLEHALLELWERRWGRMLTLAGYRESGGVESAIAQRAEAIYASFSPEQQAITRRVLLRLTELGEGTEDTRRRATLGEVVRRADEHQSVEQVVHTLADARLLTTSRDEAAGEALLDVAHEALIRGWPRLRQWLDEDRAALRVHRRLTEAAQEWQQMGKDEGLLYRGARLVQSVEWRKRHEAALNDLERGFLDASEALRAREQAAIAQAERDREAARQRELRLARRRAMLLGATALLALLAAGVAVSALFQSKAHLQTATSRALATQATFHLQDQLDLALLLGLEALKVADTVEARGAVLSGRERSRHLSAFLRGQGDVVLSAAFSPDGRVLASGTQDGSLILWDVAARGPLQRLAGRAAGVTSLAFSPDGKTVASGTQDGSLILWDVSTGGLLQQRAADQPQVRSQRQVLSVTYSPDGRTVVAVSRDGHLVEWDITTGAGNDRTLDGPSAGVNSAAFSPDGRQLATASMNTGILLWDLAARSPSRPLGDRSASVGSLAFSPDGKRLASGGADGTVSLWDLPREQEIGRTRERHGGSVTTLAFSPDGTRLASGSVDMRLMLWDVSREAASIPQIDEPLAGHMAPVTSLAFSPDGTTLASGDREKNLLLWEAAPSRPPGLPAPGQAAGTSTQAVSPDGKRLASVGEGNAVIISDVATGQRLGPALQGDGSPLTSVAFNPDGRMLASGNLYGSVIVWDVPTRQQIGPSLTGGQQPVVRLAFSSDGRTLTSGSADGSERQWDIGFDPAAWQARVCSLVGRNLSPDEEWPRYFPDEPYRQTCPDVD